MGSVPDGSVSGETGSGVGTDGVRFFSDSSGVHSSHCEVPCFKGSVTKKTVPLPTALLTAICPPIASTICLANDSPTPVPMSIQELFPW